MSQPLKAPFPWFGGKRVVAPVCWRRFGRVKNYVEPFAGSLAVLLACPHPGHTETVNDRDGLLCNFWRALQRDPESVAAHADYPISELDLHSRHRWLIAQKARVHKLLEDPDFFDAKIAGWWVWGLSQWIGSGWCQAQELRTDGTPREKIPLISARGGEGRTGSPVSGVHARSFGRIPHVSMGGNGGGATGVHRVSFGQMPVVSARGGGSSGAQYSGVFSRKFRQDNLRAYMEALAGRLRETRIICGDFARVLTPSVTWKHGLTAVLLDPPYAGTDQANVYGLADGGDTFERAYAWAIANGEREDLRIAFCCLDTVSFPPGWTRHAWKRNPGYGGQAEGQGRYNAQAEVVWFSPHSLPEQE